MAICDEDRIRDLEDEVEDLTATIARVKAVVDEYEDKPASGELYPLWREIRATLDGGQ